MTDVSRRNFVTASTVLASAAGAVAALGIQEAHAADAPAGGPPPGGISSGGMSSGGNGFQAASMLSGPINHRRHGPGLQDIYAIAEVTGGGEKIYAIAFEYDTNIDPASLALDTYTTGVFPAARGFFPGMPQEPNKDATTATAQNRPVAAIYTNAEPARCLDQKSVPGVYVIAEFHHNPDLSLPTTDSDKVQATQNKSVRTVGGAVYAGSSKVWSNAGPRGDNVFIRAVDKWEQNHWWWDDAISAWLEYSIYLPQSFLQPGGENKEYPLILAITHSGTSYDGTCAETLTEQCIAAIWSFPEVQDVRECVVITPRYERTTMNDYWEHTADVENTHRLVETLLKNTWNYGNPNLPDRANKVLKIDPTRVYCTGWSMGAMSSLWLMAKHPQTFAAGLIIAGQQRPSDVVTLAHQKLLIITGSEDNKATPWNEKCVPVWEHAGARVTRPAEYLDPSLIFPIENQQKLDNQVNGYLAQGGNITFLTFNGVDHMGSARKFFYIKAARDWLLKQVKA